MGQSGRLKPGLQTLPFSGRLRIDRLLSRFTLHVSRFICHIFSLTFPFDLARLLAIIGPHKLNYGQTCCPQRGHDWTNT